MVDARTPLPRPALLRGGALTAAALLLGCAACGSGGAADDGGGDGAGPAVVATTTWQAAFARAAGAEDVTVIVPASVQHAPDYEPRPSDLAAVADAEFVLYSPFESFAGQITEAAGSGAEAVEVNADNSPEVVTAEVEKLGERFGTAEAAREWLAKFDAVRAELREDVEADWPGGERPAAVAQVYAGWAAELAGAEVVGTYGPDQVTPEQVAELSAANPALVLDNAHMSTGAVLPDSGAVEVDVVNYPGEDQDLLALYRANAEAIGAALRGEEAPSPRPGSGGDGGGHEADHDGHGGGGGGGGHR
ncbi:metal ABC transporter solute-binding protein, Zn/Mn family [Streptomonospora nanhaiensis]|uniref:Zinc transport system substrate-binding protein n=1 Tax=Streptomonospora nanhaiensis TaxID=1323731 RepID=A0A853BS23_9ACTN|nr:zinc ABC transporter substrate-binding protein [Streptomonospora nanhaiensis]MBV2366762.1 metal ABC transporter substrate-binding protein [Streptomonospora nanhaiensis]MBX9389469.1 metal ABC transporter substrate-binding protein [Streptomonospora nanhaiensis]NYI98188.1 zinc transport system substrate-binding protein [Streptomonospora nanhaiensis]